MYVHIFFLASETYSCCFLPLSLSPLNLQHYTISYFVLVDYKYRGELRFIEPWINLYIIITMYTCNHLKC